MESVVAENEEGVAVADAASQTRSRRCIEDDLACSVTERKLSDLELLKSKNADALKTERDKRSEVILLYRSELDRSPQL